MTPIDPLMMEHRIIERMIGLMKQKLHRIRESNYIDPIFIDMATDFLRTYADQTHHGKEAGILFLDLAKRVLAPEHKLFM